MRVSSHEQHPVNRAPYPRRLVFSLILALGLVACNGSDGRDGDAPSSLNPESRQSAQRMDVPMAEKRPHIVEAPAGSREDPWYWLRDDERADPDLIAYLERENEYLEQVLEPTRKLQDELFEEMRGRIVEDDSTVPVLRGGYWYYTRYEPGREHPIHARRKGTMSAPEQVLLDENERAEGHSYFRIGGRDISPDQRQLAWLEDTVGRRQYEIRIRNLDTGQIHEPGIGGVSSLAWAADGRTLFYVRNDPDTLRSHQVRRYHPDQDGDPPVVYQEDDTSFYTRVFRSKSDGFIGIYLRSTVSSEMRILPAADPDGEFRAFLPRQRNHEYMADHLGDRWIVRTNWEAPNFRIMEVPVGQESNQKAWRELVPHDEEVFIHDVEAFHDFLAIGERSEGLRRIRIIDLRNSDGDRASRLIDSDESAYAASLGINVDQFSPTLRYNYTSMTTPMSTYEVDMRTGERKLLKQDQVPGGFRTEDYVTRLVWATARDGEKIPVSLLYHRDTELNGKPPLYQYAYGSYGASMDPTFSPVRLSLVDRGFVFAIAHVRGGQEMGRRWYDDGRLLNKMNTFQDFIDVTDYLVAEGYADPERIYAMGGSAGGLLIGSVANMAPELYHGLVARVPFVDVVTTMLDETIPLTTNEYDEWGNPEEEAFYKYMLSYSPYDNVREQEYPHMLVTSGLWDSQVQYWEPTKWVARLRHHKTDNNRLLLYTDMEAGHSGQAGRFQRLKEAAMEYAFVLTLAGGDFEGKPQQQ